MIFSDRHIIRANHFNAPGPFLSSNGEHFLKVGIRGSEKKFDLYLKTISEKDIHDFYNFFDKAKNMFLLLDNKTFQDEKYISFFTANPVPNGIVFPVEWKDYFKKKYGANYVNHSGGAIGSDSYWGEIGGMYGVESLHYWHGKITPNGNKCMTENEFNEGVKHVMKANETLHRRPEKYMNLLARNYNQVKNCDEVFAIGHFKNKMVDGGTGWAVQMAIDDGKIVNFYDQEKCVWARYSNGKWERNDVPILTQNFAGIGSRDLNENGKNAIRQVYVKTFEA